MNDDYQRQTSRGMGVPWGPPVRIAATVQLEVNIAGRNFKVEADTMPEATAKMTEQIDAAVEENDAHSGRMEDFLAAR